MFSATSTRYLSDTDRELIDRVRRSRAASIPNRVIDLDREDPWALARQQRENSGVWPISFSYPRGVPFSGRRRRVLAGVYPGVPYAFSKESAYLAQYRTSHWAVTHRKGGWDCFRHLEIIFAGALPLMPDAHRIPDATMVFYPRRAMTRLHEVLRLSGPFVSADAARRLQGHASRWLSSAAMARYLLRAVGYSGGPVLFVDRMLKELPDYLSVMTVIGLKQALGPAVLEWRSTSYLYEDHRGSTQHLYGRGFGYSRVLPPELRRDDEVGQPLMADRDFIADLRRVRPGLVVFGSLERAPYELMLWREMPADERPPAAVLYGGDSGPTDAELALIRDLPAHVFVRESTADLARTVSPGRGGA